MSAMKDFLIDLLDQLVQSGMDYESVAEKFGMDPAEVYDLAQEYGDLE
jgi:hypothetical protein